MPSEEVTALYAGAVNYADAAQLVLSHSQAAGRDGLILPTHTMIGLSIELCLKAVFLHKGGDPNILKKIDVRHNLVALRKINQDAGFITNVAGVDKIIDTIGDNYAAHEYRYMKPNSDIKFVSGEGVIVAIQALVDEVALEVGLQLRPSPPS